MTNVIEYGLIILYARSLYLRNKLLLLFHKKLKLLKKITIKESIHVTFGEINLKFLEVEIFYCIGILVKTLLEEKKS